MSRTSPFRLPRKPRAFYERLLEVATRIEPHREHLEEVRRKSEALHANLDTPPEQLRTIEAEELATIERIRKIIDTGMGGTLPPEDWPAPRQKMDGTFTVRHP